MRPGRFITLEGGEGAGKSTQAVILAERLRGAGIDVVVTREPGGTAGAEAIRALVVNGSAERWDAVTEALLINAARADHVARLIRPALAAGRWVISDRFVDSTLAYQGAGKGADPALLRVLHGIASSDLWPDLTLILDLPVAEGLARAASRRSGEARFEGYAPAFHERVRAAFAAAAQAEPGRCRIVDGRGSTAEVADRLWQAAAPMSIGQAGGAPC